MVNLIHPNTKIPKSTKLGMGNVIFDNVHISYNVNLGNHCIISNFSDIGHDLQSKDFLTIMPGTIIGGNCKIGKKSFIWRWCNCESKCNYREQL